MVVVNRHACRFTDRTAVTLCRTTRHARMTFLQATSPLMPTTTGRKSRSRSGFSLIELLIVIAILCVVYLRLIPIVSEIKARSALRATRQQLISAVAAARNAALQKGRLATLTLSSTGASVTVLNASTGTASTILGPLSFNAQYGTLLNALSSAPTTVTFDPRGLVTPAAASISKYQISISQWADTVCMSGSGMVLRRGCQL